MKTSMRVKAASDEMPRKRRVMLVGPWKWTVGGVTTFMLNLVESPLAASNAFLRFNTARPAKRNVTDNYGYAAIFRGGIARVLSGAIVTLFHLAAFPFVLLYRRPDIVQVQSSDFQVFWESAAYVQMCRMFRIPVVMRLGGSFDHFYAASSVRAQAAIRRVLQWPDRLIVQSEYWRRFVAGVGRTNGVFVVGNAVPESLTVPLSRPQRPVPVCLFVAGSNATWKGFDEVRQAMVLLETSGVRVHCRVIGATQSLMRRVASDDGPRNMLLEGHVDHAEIISAMRSADIFLLPSHSEGFPNALIEAMATGLACIVTPVGAVPEIIGADAAIVVPVKDAGALADAIRQLAGDPALRGSLGQAAQDTVSTRYAQSAVLPRLEQGWQLLLDDKSTLFHLCIARKRSGPNDGEPGR
ncbi:MAG TPA: glycosyltransferase family 4 protein [Rhizomicrobium sp.]